MIGERLHVCSDVLRQIRDSVDNLVYHLDPDKGCLFDYCSISCSSAMYIALKIWRIVLRTSFIAYLLKDSKLELDKGSMPSHAYHHMYINERGKKQEQRHYTAGNPCSERRGEVATN